MLQVSRATPGPVLTARFGGRSPQPPPSPQACLMHEAQNFTTYFPVIFCMESGSSATKNLKAVWHCPPPHGCPPRSLRSLPTRRHSVMP